MTSKQQKSLRLERMKMEQRKSLIIRIISGTFLLIVIVVFAIINIKKRFENVEPASIPYKQYENPPPMEIDINRQYYATVTMAGGGVFIIQLFPDKAPVTVNSFVFLAKEGYFNGVTFHRVLKDFMAQTGDPTGTGSGGPGYQFINEDNDLVFDKPGVVAMANAGRDTNGSQFFITFGPAEHLNGGYTIFGQVIEGMDVVYGITLRDPNKYPDYPGDMINSIVITEK